MLSNGAGLRTNCWALALAAACVVACLVAVAGEAVALPEAGELLLSEDLLYKLAGAGGSSWAPSCCALGIGLWLVLGGKRQPAAPRGKVYEPLRTYEAPNPAAAAAPRAAASPRKASSRKSHRSCLFCGFLENCLEPAGGAADPVPESPLACGGEGQETAEAPVVCEASRELRARLSDLLGPVPVPSASGGAPAAAPDPDAAATIARFGGEHSCFHRFLHAKRFHVARTEQKLRKTIAWRKQVGANDALSSPFAKQAWALLKPVWPEKVIGDTADGSPITYFDLSQAIRACRMDMWTEANIQAFYVAWMEQSLRQQREGRQRHGPCGDGNNMPATVVVYNLKDLRFSHIVQCVKGLAALVKILGIIDEHYPENLRKGVIINVPCIFHKMIWPLVQKALDARTLSNIHLSEGEGREVLSEVIGIPLEEVNTLLSGALRDS